MPLKKTSPIRYKATCPSCNAIRMITTNYPNRLCLSCSCKRTWATKERRPLRTAKPHLGEVRYGRDLGIKDKKHPYIWVNCPDCGKLRWVTYRKSYKDAYTVRCVTCRSKYQVGENASNWKGGIRHHTEGYLGIKLNPINFFYPMADVHGYVSEHRLILAKHLNRCLLPWEVVHHINSNRKDNALNNLELLPSRKYHVVDTQLKSLATRQTKRIKYLENLMTQRGDGIAEAVREERERIIKYLDDKFGYDYSGIRTTEIRTGKDFWQQLEARNKGTQ